MALLPVNISKIGVPLFSNVPFLEPIFGDTEKS